MPRAMAVLLVVYSYWSIQENLAHLPARIPTRFNWAGEPTAWSSPHQLWVLLGVQIFGIALFWVIPALGRRFPQTVNLGWRRLSDFTPEERERIMPMLEEMCGWLGLLFSFLFSFLIRDLIRVALSPGARAHSWPVGVFLAGCAVVLIYYLRRMNREASPDARTGT